MPEIGSNAQMVPDLIVDAAEILGIAYLLRMSFVAKYFVNDVQYKYINASHVSLHFQNENSFNLFRTNNITHRLLMAAVFT